MILTDYFWWHYRVRLKETAAHSLILLRAIGNYFSLIPLAKSLFAPWRRVREPYRSGSTIGGYLWTLAANLVSRLVGMAVRLIVISAGLAAAAAAIVVRGMYVVIWAALPVVILGCLLAGVTLLAF